MDDATLMSNWLMSLALAAVVIVIAAALLITIWLSARRILKLALIALEVVQKIRANTQSVWLLKDTNETATKILNDAVAIRDHGLLVVGALHESTPQSKAA